MVKKLHTNNSNKDESSNKIISSNKNKKNI